MSQPEPIPIEPMIGLEYDTPLTASKIVAHFPAPAELVEDLAGFSVAGYLANQQLRGQRINERRERWAALRAKHQGP